MIIICQSLGSRPILVLELFTLVPRLFGTTSRCLSIQPVQLLPSRNIWRHISLIWPFPHRYHHSPWPVDVTELFPRFCCWTLIWLLRHWAWLRQGYWRYRSFIDWLIELLLESPVQDIWVVVKQGKSTMTFLIKMNVTQCSHAQVPSYFSKFPYMKTHIWCLLLSRIVSTQKNELILKTAIVLNSVSRPEPGTINIHWDIIIRKEKNKE